MHSIEPGSPGRPAPRNQAAPNRPISARWASVSTFWTRVGRPPIPCSQTGRGANRGRAGPPLSALTTAEVSPARNRSGAWITSAGSGSHPAAARWASTDVRCPARAASRCT